MASATPSVGSLGPIIGLAMGPVRAPTASAEYMRSTATTDVVCKRRRWASPSMLADELREGSELQRDSSCVADAGLGPDIAMTSVPTKKWSHCA